MKTGGYPKGVYGSAMGGHKGHPAGGWEDADTAEMRRWVKKETRKARRRWAKEEIRMGLLNWEAEQAEEEDDEAETL